MYNKFCVTSLDFSAIEKTITIGFNYDLDETTVTLGTINLSSSGGTAEPFTIEISSDTVILHLTKWPDNTVDYYITIDSTVANIVGTTLGSNFKKQFNFPQEITSIVTIESPYNFEKLDELAFTFSDSEGISKYYVEIAKDNRFYELVYNSAVKVNNFKPILKDMSAGQYYIRVRCQQGSEYGQWSDITTFIYKYICDDDEPEEEGPKADDYEKSAWEDLYSSDSTVDADGNVVSKSSSSDTTPIVEVEDTLEVVTKPDNGETPTSFVFEFDKDLDINFGEVVIIKRGF